MWRVFVGCYDYNTRQSELEQLFSKYGRVDRVEMRAGYSYVYFEDERDAKSAIRWLHKTPFGDEERRLNVEWAKEAPRKTNLKPTKTLFVFNFDRFRTTNDDIKRHFEPYGDVLNVKIVNNYSFVKFATQKDATKALKATQRSKILDRVISVEYATPDKNKRDSRYSNSPRRSFSNGRHRSRSHRSQSHQSRSHRSQSHRSPAYERRRSQDYGRRHRTRSPRAGYDRYSNSPRRSFSNGRSLSPPIYRRRHRSQSHGSPAYERGRSRDYGRRRRTRSPRVFNDRYRNISGSPERRRRS